MNNLQWGQTPWDKLSREQLLQEIMRMYSALVSLSSAARCAMGSDPYWREGMGGVALEKARQIFAPLYKKHSSEDIYRAFFRYADDVLFDCSKHNYLGSDWIVCSKCGRMIGDMTKRGMVCMVALGVGNCEGRMRILTREDLQPEKRRLPKEKK